MIPFFLCLIAFLSFIAGAEETVSGDYEHSIEQPKAAPAPAAPMANAKVFISGCAKNDKPKVACKEAGHVFYDNHSLTITDVGGALVAVSPTIKMDKEIQPYWFVGRVPNQNLAGFMAPCDLTKGTVSLPRMDKTCPADQDNTCTPAGLIKEFEQAGLKLAIKKQISPVMFNAEQAGLFGFKKYLKVHPLAVPKDPHFGPMCYFQFKKP